MPFSLWRLRSTYRSVHRIREIINVFLKHGFGRVIDQIHFQRFIPLRTRLKTFGQWPALRGPGVPERLRIAFSELGPTFIKFAQILSSRPDLVTKEYADEFRKLQDEVPPFSSDEAKAIIDRETGFPVSEIFLSFGDAPLAAASIAQVHEATLRDGKKVIVKVQRPGIAETIETDIGIMSTIANLLDKYVPESRFFNPKGIVGEFSKTIRKELDFVEEARNCRRFRKNFEESTTVYIPETYDRFITSRMLVMERIDGVRIDDIHRIDSMALDRRQLARAGVNAYFKQILEDGFFHADPHPGNIFAMPDGRIGLMDFGIVGRVSAELREMIASTFLALIRKDFNKLVNQYIELGIIPEDADIGAFRREFMTDVSDFLEPLYGLTLSEINFAQYLDTLTRLALKHNMKIPAELLLINKAMLIVENIGRQLDPQFDFIAEAEPYAARLIRQKLHPAKVFENTRENIKELGDLAVLFPRQLKQLMRKVLKDDLHLKLTHLGLERLIRDMDRSSNRIAFSMVIGSMLLSSAIMHAFGAQPRLFGMSLFALVSFAVAFFLGIWLLVSILRSGRL